MALFLGTNLLDQLGSFEELQSDVRTMVFWSFAALAITGSILVFGVQKGIERAVVALILLWPSCWFFWFFLIC